MIKLDEGEDDRFVLQARTDRALNKEGEQTSATIFTAFAATDFVDTFNVELNPNKTGELNGSAFRYLSFTRDDPDPLFVPRNNKCSAVRPLWVSLAL